MLATWVRGSVALAILRPVDAEAGARVEGWEVMGWFLHSAGEKTRATSPASIEGPSLSLSLVDTASFTDSQRAAGHQ